MIYLFTGSDEARVRTKAFAWIEKARAKEPQLAYIRLAKADITSSSLADIAESQGLFVRRLLAVLDDPYGKMSSGDDERSASTVLDEQVSALAQSDNAILVIAPRLTASQLKKLERHAKLVYRFDQAEARIERGFNMRLVQALAERSREKLWLEIVRALRAGDAPEMIHGILHWKMRDLIAKGDRRWSEHELLALSRKCILLLSSARRRGIPLEYALEQFALSLS